MGGTQVSSFTLANVPTLTGKVAIVTGGNAGIGFAIAKALASKGATVIIASRNAERVKGAVARLLEMFPSATIIGMTVEVSSFSSIETFVEGIKKQFTHIDMLINNAGVVLQPFFKTEQGFEVTFGTNVMGTTYLTNLLLPLVKKSSDGRIVFLSSSAANVSLNLFKKYLRDVGGKWLTSSSLEGYAVSKLFDSLIALELQRRLHDAGVKNVQVYAVDPGFIKSGIIGKVSDDYAFLRGLVQGAVALLADTPENGALSSLYAATAKIEANMRGQTFSPGPKVGPYSWSNNEAFNAENALLLFNAVQKEIVDAGYPAFEV